MKIGKVIKSIVILSIFLSLLFANSVVAISWISHSTAYASDSMFVSDQIERCNADTSCVADADDHDNIKILVDTDSVIEEGRVSFEYDFGKNGLGGSASTQNKLYRAQVTWYMDGFFDDNNDATTYFKFVYSLYYMSGSSRINAGSAEVKYNSGDITFYISNAVNHYVYSSGYIPSGKTLYVDLEVTLSGAGTWAEKDLDSDFYTANHIELYKVVYQYTNDIN